MGADTSCQASGTGDRGAGRMARSTLAHPLPGPIRLTGSTGRYTRLAGRVKDLCVHGSTTARPQPSTTPAYRSTGRRSAPTSATRDAGPDSSPVFGMAPVRSRKCRKRSVARFFVFTHSRVSGLYGSRSRFATTPSSPRATTASHSAGPSSNHATTSTSCVGCFAYRGVAGCGSGAVV
jgi:hypothetical protein